MHLGRVATILLGEPFMPTPSLAPGSRGDSINLFCQDLGRACSSHAGYDTSIHTPEKAPLSRSVYCS